MLSSLPVFCCRWATTHSALPLSMPPATRAALPSAWTVWGRLPWPIWRCSGTGSPSTPSARCGAAPLGLARAGDGKPAGPRRRQCDQRHPRLSGYNAGPGGALPMRRWRRPPTRSAIFIRRRAALDAQFAASLSSIPDSQAKADRYRSARPSPVRSSRYAPRTAGMPLSLTKAAPRSGSGGPPARCTPGAAAAMG